MDYTIAVLPFLAILTWIFLHVQSKRSSSKKSARLPPGPYGYPVIGNALQLGEKPHQSLAKLSKTYGPLMHLKLGSRTTVVVSSPEVAKDVLQKYDQHLSSRTVPDVATTFDHKMMSMVWLPVGSQWRNLRKICKENMFSLQRLEGSQGLRLKKVGELREFVEECCVKGEALDIGGAAFTTSLNLISNTLFSVDFVHYRSDMSHELKEIVWGLMEVGASPNLADFFPIFRFADLQGLERRAKLYMGKLFGIFDGIINQRLQSRTESSVNSPAGNDLLEVLLELHQKNDSELSILEMKHFLLDLFVGGADTTAGTIEWAMAELVRHPDILAKVREELKVVLGDNRLVEESDIPKLSYLQAVVKETFRLHPIVPLLVPHKAETDVEINGYLVPKNAQVLVNVWAMGRDSNTWGNADSFEPERFLGSEIDIKGKDFKLIPFGSGRRICPGLPLAYRMVHLGIASMIHKLDWELENGMKPKDVDMNEKFGLTLQRVQPLRAIPKKV